MGTQNRVPIQTLASDQALPKALEMGCCCTSMPSELPTRMLRICQISLVVFLIPWVVRAQEAHPEHHGRALLPDPIETPGDVLTTDATTVCKPHYTETVRHVTEGVKHQVYLAYGKKPKPKVCCEVDHFIPLELGGSNDFRNLWPEPYLPRPGAREKDVVENWLHAQVCKAGTMTLAEAQEKIRTDWYAVYLALHKPK